MKKTKQNSGLVGCLFLIVKVIFKGTNSNQLPPPPPPPKHMEILVPEVESHLERFMSEIA